MRTRGPARRASFVALMALQYSTSVAQADPCGPVYDPRILVPFLLLVTVAFLSFRAGSLTRHRQVFRADWHPGHYGICALILLVL